MSTEALTRLISVTALYSSFQFQLKSLNVGVEDSARECIRSALRALDLSHASAAALAPDENDASAANVNSPSSLQAGTANSSNNNNNAGYQLWVRTKLDESPYPLIGHEVGRFM